MSELDLRDLLQSQASGGVKQSARDEARAREVRKWMKEKRKERSDCKLKTLSVFKFLSFNELFLGFRITLSTGKI